MPEPWEDEIAQAQIDNLIYWAGRTAKTQAALYDKTTEQAQRQLAKYYAQTQKRVIADFLRTYDHIQARAKGGQVTPADLYKLDTYWQMQNQLARELEKLGEREAVYLERVFVQQYESVYKSLAVPSQKGYATISKETARQAVNTIWCADGQSWSARIWGDVEALKTALNENLIETITAGRTSERLKAVLMEDFQTCYYCADRIVRTETAHITSNAAIQRYKDSGIKQMQFWAEEDERRCDVCGQLHEKIYNVTDISPIPAHPNCRCTLVPVVPIEGKAAR